MLGKAGLVLAVLLLVCLLPMPYGYYNLVRFVSMVVFAWMAYAYYQKDNEGLAITLGAMALLFQPFFKIALGRTVWNIVDVVAALGLIVLWAKTRKQH